MANKNIPQRILDEGKEAPPDASRVLEERPSETALAVYQERYPALTANVSELIRDSLGEGAHLSISDLPVVKVPSGGATFWTVPFQDDPLKTLEGVAVHYQPTRAWWEEDFTGAGTPPDCSSEDATHGKGSFGPGSELNSSGLCDTCPMSKFGSGKDNSQACKLISQLFLLMPEAVVPTRIPLPPSSYKAAREYIRDLAILHRKRLTGVTTRISLTKDKSAGGIEYSKALFSIPESLPGDVAMYMSAYRDQILPFLQANIIETDAYNVR